MKKKKLFDFKKYMMCGVVGLTIGLIFDLSLKLGIFTFLGGLIAILVYQWKYDNILYCENCECNHKVFVTSFYKYTDYVDNDKNIDFIFKYKVYIAHCSECGEIVYSEELHNKNKLLYDKSFNKALKKAVKLYEK